MIRRTAGVIAKAGPASLAAWAALILFETAAQLTLKAGGEALADVPFGWPWVTAGAANPWVLLGLVSYLGSFGAWMLVLETVPLSLGFPLTAAVMLAVAGASWLVFGEILSPARLAGIGLIMGGVLVMGGGER
jgi:multidrug transporter EmrE-like cation transporter